MVLNKFFKKQKGLLSKPAVKLPGMKDYLTWAELFHGTGLFGNAGSGKTSGVFYEYLRQILRDESKPGGFIPCVKKDDRIHLEKIIRDAGRGDDLVIVSENSPYTVNAIEYELFRKGRNQVEYNQALEILMESMLSGDNYESGAGSSGENEQFWRKEIRKCLSRLMMLLVLSETAVTIPNMRKILIDAFSSEDVEHYQKLWSKIETGTDQAQEQAINDYKEWCQHNFFLQCFDKADSRQGLTDSEMDVMGLVGDYFFKLFWALGEKTKTIITASVLGLAEPFMTGILKTHFSSKMSPELYPERCYKEGTIFLFDLPVQENGISAIYAASMMKKLFQLAVARRVVSEEINPRPVFLFCDEYHFICSPSSDDKFQSICRSHMCASLYATQSINNIEIAMGKDGAKAKTKALLTNLGTQIACGNTCKDTNTHMADIIGKDFIDMNSSSFDTNDRSSRSKSEQLHYIIPPEYFANNLRTGGEDNDFKVDTIVTVRSKKWSTGERFREVTWNQRGNKRSFWQTIKSFFI